MQTTEKITNGTIRIENGKLLGLGMQSDSIDITALDELLDAIGKEGIIEAISDVVSAIAEVLNECIYVQMNDFEPDGLKKIITDNIQPNIQCLKPFQLNLILKAFIK